MAIVDIDHMNIHTYVSILVDRRRHFNVGTKLFQQIQMA